MNPVNSAVRPMWLSVLCGLGLAGCFLKMLLVMSPVVQNHGRPYAIYLSISSVLMIGLLCGLWLMKKWAVWAFLAYFLMDQLVYYRMGTWDPKVCLLAFLILSTSLFYYRRFN